eukprot:sb/3460278/
MEEIITLFTRLPDGTEFPPNAPDRVLQVDVSSLDDLVAVIGYLMPFFQKAAETDESQLKHVKVLVPEFVCSTIIGEHGENIHRMENDFNSRVHVFNTTLPGSSENVVKVTNFDTDRLAATIGYIFESILSERTMSRVTFYNPLIWDPKDIGHTGSYNDTQYNATSEQEGSEDGDWIEEHASENSLYDDEEETGVELNSSETGVIPEEEPGPSTGGQRKFGGRRDLPPQIHPKNTNFGEPSRADRDNWRSGDSCEGIGGIPPKGRGRGRGGGRTRSNPRSIRGGRGCDVFRGGERREYRGLTRGGKGYWRGTFRDGESYYRGSYRSGEMDDIRGGERGYRGGNGNVFRGQPGGRWAEGPRGQNNGRDRGNHDEERIRRDSGRRRDDIECEMGMRVCNAMSYALLSYEDGPTQLNTLYSVYTDSDAPTLDAVKSYLCTILAKSPTLTSSHIQTITNGGISATVYYRGLDDNQVLCYIVSEHVALSPFYHELDKYTDTLVSSHLEDPKPYLERREYRGLTRGGKGYWRGTFRDGESYYRGSYRSGEMDDIRGGERGYRGGNGNVFRGQPGGRWAEGPRGQNNGRDRGNHDEERIRRDSGRRRDDIECEMGMRVCNAMSYALLSYEDGPTQLNTLYTDSDAPTLDAVKSYLCTILAKSPTLTSSHIQTITNGGISATVYYRGLDDNQVLCYIVSEHVALSPFYHELDKYTDTLVSSHLEDPKPYLGKWYYVCIEYVLRVIDYFRNDLPSLLFIALSRNNITTTSPDQEGSQIVRDTQLFISACSLKELMYNTSVVFEDTEESPMIDFTSKSVHYESSTFCVEWARQIESDGNPFSVRQALEDRKITANEDMNTFRRLLHQAETDHYAFYRGYEFVKMHSNGKVLYEMLSHESTVYSLDKMTESVETRQCLDLAFSTDRYLEPCIIDTICDLCSEQPPSLLSPYTSCSPSLQPVLQLRLAGISPPPCINHLLPYLNTHTVETLRVLSKYKPTSQDGIISLSSTTLHLATSPSLYVTEALASLQAGLAVHHPDIIDEIMKTPSHFVISFLAALFRAGEKDRAASLAELTSQDMRLCEVGGYKLLMKYRAGEVGKESHTERFWKECYRNLGNMCSSTEIPLIISTLCQAENFELLSSFLSADKPSRVVTTTMQEHFSAGGLMKELMNNVFNSGGAQLAAISVLSYLAREGILSGKDVRERACPHEDTCDCFMKTLLTFLSECHPDILHRILSSCGAAIFTESSSTSVLLSNSLLHRLHHTDCRVREVVLEVLSTIKLVNEDVIIRVVELAGSDDSFYARESCFRALEVQGLASVEGFIGRENIVKSLLRLAKCTEGQDSLVAIAFLSFLTTHFNILLCMKEQCSTSLLSTSNGSLHHPLNGATVHHDKSDSNPLDVDSIIDSVVNVGDCHDVPLIRGGAEKPAHSPEETSTTTSELERELVLLLLDIATCDRCDMERLVQGTKFIVRVLENLSSQHTIILPSNIMAHHVDAYWEYHRIVGDDVGDDVMSPEQFEEYKRTVVPERMKNRLYLSWRVTANAPVDCELIGPETNCHCQHRYRQHNSDNPEKKTSCKKCGCKSFRYVPRNTRCKCKHLTTEHGVQGGCGRCACTDMRVTWTCPCGVAAHAHSTFVETREEREAAGKPTGEDVPYAAMGGITGFSSLAPGYMRMDPSGALGDCVEMSLVRGRASVALRRLATTAAVHPTSSPSSTPPTMGRLRECAGTHNIVGDLVSSLMSDNHHLSSSATHLFKGKDVRERACPHEDTCDCFMKTLLTFLSECHPDILHRILSSCGAAIFTESSSTSVLLSNSLLHRLHHTDCRVREVVLEVLSTIKLVNEDVIIRVVELAGSDDSFYARESCFRALEVQGLASVEGFIGRENIVKSLLRLAKCTEGQDSLVAIAFLSFLTTHFNILLSEIMKEQCSTSILSTSNRSLHHPLNGATVHHDKSDSNPLDVDSIIDSVVNVGDCHDVPLIRGGAEKPAHSPEETSTTTSELERELVLLLLDIATCDRCDMERLVQGTKFIVRVLENVSDQKHLLKFLETSFFPLLRDLESPALCGVLGELNRVIGRNMFVLHAKSRDQDAKERLQTVMQYLNSDPSHSLSSQHTIILPSNIMAHHVDAYWEYHRIVGDDVGDDVMSPEQFEEYKRTVVPERMKNRLYLSWRVTANAPVDCELIGPETNCHCQHRYRQHNSDNPEKKTSCKKCGCKSFRYVPRNTRCKCKHLTTEHGVQGGCGRCACTDMRVTWTCPCGVAAHAHSTFVETREEREAAGKPTGEDVPYAAMGGITGFSSLAPGYMRMDPSGALGDCVEMSLVRGRASVALRRLATTAAVHPTSSPSSTPPTMGRLRECAGTHNIVGDLVSSLMSDNHHLSSSATHLFKGKDVRERACPHEDTCDCFMKTLLTFLSECHPDILHRILSSCGAAIFTESSSTSVLLSNSLLHRLHHTDCRVREVVLEVLSTIKLVNEDVIIRVVELAGSDDSFYARESCFRALEVQGLASVEGFIGRENIVKSLLRLAKCTEGQDSLVAIAFLSFLTTHFNILLSEIMKEQCSTSILSTSNRSLHHPLNGATVHHDKSDSNPLDVDSIIDSVVNVGDCHDVPLIRGGAEKPAHSPEETSTTTSELERELVLLLLDIATCDRCDMERLVQGTKFIVRVLENVSDQKHLLKFLETSFFPLLRDLESPALCGVLGELNRVIGRNMFVLHAKSRDQDAKERLQTVMQYLNSDPSHSRIMAHHVDAYWEYHRIVGDDVGDDLMSPEQFEEYKRTVVPERMKNRLYLSWRVTANAPVDCELIGPETNCHCQHRYRQHNSDNPEKKTSCKKCGCKAFRYVPRNTRCKCKHLTTEHGVQGGCGRCACTDMRVTWTCPCGVAAHAHSTFIETREEREAAGKPTGEDVPYAAMGGITGFSSLAPGYMRMDPSGALGDCVEKRRRTSIESNSLLHRLHHTDCRVREVVLEVLSTIKLVNEDVIIRVVELAGSDDSFYARESCFRALEVQGLASVEGFIGRENIVKSLLRLAKCTEGQDSLVAIAFLSFLTTHFNILLSEIMKEQCSTSILSTSNRSLHHPLNGATVHHDKSDSNPLDVDSIIDSVVNVGDCHDVPLIRGGAEKPAHSPEETSTTTSELERELVLLLLDIATCDRCDMERLRIMAHHVDAYWEYHRIVGDDVGDDVMSPEQFEEYKRTVVPERMKNRLYLSWRVTANAPVDCELIGPETNCHCQHRYRQHNSDNPEKKTSCKKCGCKAFRYVPRNTRCKCEHLTTEHGVQGGCGRCACTDMRVTWTCPCGVAAHAHSTFVETREEREAAGKPTGEDVPYAAMGGITGFSSLAPGYMRMDPSGALGDCVELEGSLEAPNIPRAIGGVERRGQSSRVGDLVSSLMSDNHHLSSSATHLFKGGGKYFRPTSVTLMGHCCNHGSQTTSSNQRQIALISELIHVASLVHDDVLDSAYTRRSLATVNALYNERVAILAGDFIIARATSKLAQLGCPETITILSSVIRDLIKGEILQLHSSSPSSPADLFGVYIEKTYLKTASLISHSCQAVALNSSRPHLQNAAFSYGKNLGIAFQLVDDMLDFVASSTEMGKAASGSDLKLGLATAPVLYAARDFPQLNDMILRGFSREGDAEEAFNLVGQSEGVEMTRQLAERYCTGAIRDLEVMPDNGYSGVKQVQEEKRRVAQPMADNDPFAPPSRIYGMLGDMGDSRILNIKINSATGLLKKDLIGLSDPFVKIFLCSEQQEGGDGSDDSVIGIPAETSIQKRTLNPSWDEVFQFRVNPSRQYLLLEVWDHNKLTSDDFLGMYRFSLFHLPVNNSAVEWDAVPTHDMILKQRSKRSRVKGKLHVQFRYETSADQGEDGEVAGPSEVEQEDTRMGWESVSEPEPLPEGWEERVDFSNRVVYVDHVNRVVTLDRPTAPTPGSVQHSRASIIQRQHSSFENRRQISEDNLDTEQAEASASAPIDPSEVTHDLVQTYRQLQNEWEALDVEELTEQPEEEAAAAVAVQEEEEEEEQPLPEGWEETTTFGGERVYVKSSDSSVHLLLLLLRVSGVNPKELSRLSSMRFGRHCVSAREFELLNEPQRPSSIQTDGPGPSVPEPESPLPAGWAKGKDQGSGRTFYIDHNSRTTSWEKPKTRTDGLYAALGPLPDGWEMRYKNGRPFFIQHRTKVTTWHDPRQENPLPDGWEMRLNHADGRVFYVDHSTKSTQWEDPRLHKESSGPAIQYSRDYKVKYENFRANLPQPSNEWEALDVEELTEQPEEEAAAAVAVQEEEEQPLPEGWEETTTFGGERVYVNRSLRRQQSERPVFELLNEPQRPSSIQTDGPGPSVPEPDSPLPAGWAKGKDQGSGRTFYIDHNSRTTSWEKPKTRTDGLYAALGPLPDGWEMRYKNGRPFFIQHRTKVTTWHDPRQENPLPDGWEMRLNHADGRVFYVDHSTKSTQWEDPRLHKESSGPAIQYSRDYKVKYENFRANLPQPSSNTAKCEVRVSRKDILANSFDSIMSKTSSDLIKRLWVVFDGEPGLDYGGVAREWFYSLSKEMFNPYYGLWEYSAIDNYTIQINPNSGMCNPEHLRYFEFSGRICAMAVYHGKLIDGFFIRPFYKMILGKQIVLDDMAEVDIETYNSLQWVMDNDPEDLFLTFCAQESRFGEQRMFYVDHSTKSTQWEDPRLHKESSGPAIQYSRDYKVKYENFRANLPQPSSNTAKCEVRVSRKALLANSFDSIMSKTSSDLIKRLWVVFDGEPGLDYGGVAREWFYSLSKEMFNPYYGLWEYSAIDNYTIQINPNSGMCNPEHLRYFEFSGRICAMAVYHGKLIDGFFIRPFYKMILGKQIVLDDMAEVDIETYNSLQWVMDNDPEDLFLTFCAQESRFGEVIETPLVAGGENIDVTNFNKVGYVTAYIQWKFANRIEEQIKAFKKGFAYIIPLSKLAVFDENELEYLICGIAQIDVEDWSKYTEFKGGYSSTHHVIVWFWKAIRSFDNEFKARLLQFVTGTSRVPMNGFRELQGSNGPQKFCIEKWGSPNDLPRAHTCFNRIDLPPYKDYHTLKDKLKMAATPN